MVADPFPFKCINSWEDFLQLTMWSCLNTIHKYLDKKWHLDKAGEIPHKILHCGTILCIKLWPFDVLNSTQGEALWKGMCIMYFITALNYFRTWGWSAILLKIISGPLTLNMLLLKVIYKIIFWFDFFKLLWVIDRWLSVCFC